MGIVFKLSEYIINYIWFSEYSLVELIYMIFFSRKQQWTKFVCTAALFKIIDVNEIGVLFFLDELEYDMPLWRAVMAIEKLFKCGQWFFWLISLGTIISVLSIIEPNQSYAYGNV